MIIYGKNPIKDLYNKNPEEILEIWIEKKRHQSFFNELFKNGIKMNKFTDFNFKKSELSGEENCQGIIAKIKDITFISLKDLIYKNKDNNKAKFLILDGIEDPQNFGAILRNAASFDVDGVIFPNRNSARINSTVMKTSAGNWIYLDLCQTASLNQVIDTLKKEGYWIISTSLEGKETLDDLKNLKQPMAIILGNEGRGVKKSLQDKSDFKIKIKINKNVNSLNVSSTSAIILHYLK